MRAHLPGFAGAFLVVNNEAEKGNATEESLKSITEQADLPIPTVPFRVERYTWTAGINSGAAILNELAKEKNIDARKVRVINMSFDTDIADDELDKLKSEIEAQRFILTERKTADKKPPISERGFLLWKKFTDLLRKPEDANLAEIAYLMRNTMNIIRLSDIIEMGGFNPTCNGIHGTDDRESKKSILKSVSLPREEENLGRYVKGMEDAEFFMRLILLALKWGQASTLKEMRRAFDNPILYEDKSWTNFKETERTNKTINDIISLSVILKRGVTEEYVLPEDKRDFILRR